jgi:hypothetical protein
MKSNTNLCVEANLARNLPIEIRLHLLGRVHIQKVIYVNLLNTCFVCVSLDHLIEACP